MLRGFEESLMMKIFGPKRDEVTGKWRRLHDDELYDLYSSPNNIRMINSRRMRWAEHVARMGGEKWCMQSFSGDTSGKETAWNT
jgi:hypothetical protein